MESPSKFLFLLGYVNSLKQKLSAVICKVRANLITMSIKTICISKKAKQVFRGHNVRRPRSLVRGHGF